MCPFSNEFLSASWDVIWDVIGDMPFGVYVFPAIDAMLHIQSKCGLTYLTDMTATRLGGSSYESVAVLCTQ